MTNRFASKTPKTLTPKLLKMVQNPKTSDFFDVLPSNTIKPIPKSLHCFFNRFENKNHARKDLM